MKKIFLIYIIFILSFFVASEIKADSASLFLSPASGNYSVGSQFSVKIRLDSNGAPINASKATIFFPTDLLGVQNISKSGSIFSLWPEEPVFSNSQRTVTFAGGVPAPGFTGAGTILTINFKAKKEGVAKVSFTEGMVLKADGRGTNILGNMTGGTYTIGPGVPEIPGLPGKPKITSPTHPNQDAWYNNSNPLFQWKISSEIIGVSTDFDKNPDTEPIPISGGVFDSKTYEKIGDGIWYFHLKVKNDVGWSETAHYRVKIDTAPPRPFDITVDNEGDPTNPNPILYFTTEDDLSGLSHYEMKIGEGDVFSVVIVETNPFYLPNQAPGTHKIVIKAIDRAGNQTPSETILSVESIPAPEILIYPEVYSAGKDVFYVEGWALPDSTVLVFFKRGEKLIKAWETPSDKDGNWSFSTEELFKGGDYFLSARTKNARGAISNPSPEYHVKVALSGISIGPWAISFSLLGLILLILIIIFAAVLIYIILSRTKKDKDKLMKEVKEAEESLKKNFDKLRKDIEIRIEYFDSKPGMSPTEKRLRDRLFYFLKSSEDSIKKEIEDIERELNNG